MEEQNIMLFKTYSYGCNYWDKRLVIAGCLEGHGEELRQQ